MKDKILVAGAVCAIFVAGFGFGGVTVYNYARINGLENGQAQIVQGANKAIEDLKKDIDTLKTAQASAPAKKGG
jgi:hypothetical protein